MHHRKPTDLEGRPFRPTAKRSPSILVTDVRSSSVKGARAPFAGHSLKKQQEQQLQQQPHHLDILGKSYPSNPQNLHRLKNRVNRYTDISIDKLLSNSSDIPSGQRRLPSSLSRDSRSRSPPLRSVSPSSSNGNYNMVEPILNRRGNIRSIPKLTQSLPMRKSMTSQRLVLIPEHMRAQSPPLVSSNYTPVADIMTQLHQIQRSRAELITKEERALEFSRMTAYFICEEIDLDAVSKYLEDNHNVKPRIYDEALYVPYALPLLPGNDGLRVRSNDSAKSASSKKYMDKLIKKSEQANHLYEYYSGVETIEDANNYSMDPEFDNNQATPFDPSEPQFFAPPILSDERPRTEDLDSTTADPSSLDTSKEQSLNEDSEFAEGEEIRESTHDSNKNDRQEHDEFRRRSRGSRENLSNLSDSSNSSTHSFLESQIELSKHYGEMFVFAYGIVVFWNFSEIHEKNILADLMFASHTPPLLINPIDEQYIETEEFHFDYDSYIQRPRIFNDMITLRSADHLIKLTMSHAIAQLTKLCLFESRMVNILQLISKLPKKLALTGRVGLKRQQITRKSGKLFKLRVDVNLSSSILDTPDFFWSDEPALHPLYNAVREYLEIDERVQVLNDRCKVFLEFLDITSDSMNEKNTNRITWMIIVIIFLSLFVSIFEFFL
ncbi:uncharacterized protein KQ657_000334 [Scheffersomyces spartinae]|uniref:DUF155 domain-containing protein n=1 Tax=Scheffersomyces spartinae TaxID=45513 RepID=A0A9P8AIG6_9ASCO|nr:uncharacterized protein KQ657_000334 [Scheffersomyces spartinae]KAG7193649.1 hypothetical protein KQ657_000334 [Scheffersomyces spartinae]